MSLCLFVPKDLANRWTDMVLIYNVASHCSIKFTTIWVTTTLPRELAPRKCGPKQFFFLFEKLKLKMGRGTNRTLPSVTVPRWL